MRSSWRRFIISAAVIIIGAFKGVRRYPLWVIASLCPVIYDDGGSVSQVTVEASVLRA